MILLINIKKMSILYDLKDRDRRFRKNSKMRKIRLKENIELFQTDTLASAGVWEVKTHFKKVKKITLGSSKGDAKASPPSFGRDLL